MDNMNILIITDNFLIHNQFYLLIDSLSDTNFNISYASSPNTDSAHFWRSDTNNFKTIDMKNDREVDKLIDKYDLIFSLHCKQLFPRRLVNNIKCINIHPGYLPTNRGWFPQVFALMYNLELGVTIHEMDELLDNGPIIDRIKVPIYEWDTSFTAYNRVLSAEMRLLDNNFIKIINNDYKTIDVEDGGNIFYKKDFDRLCEIDLDQRCTYRDVINHLRALTHGDINNAYFYASNGDKIFLKLNMEKEK